MIACTVARKGRVAVAEPYFEPGTPFTLGRRAMGELDVGDLVLVEPTGKGNGRLVLHIGRPENIHDVMHALALEADVADAEPFAPGVPEPDDGDIDRVDLRDLLTFTIDPPTAKDFDDALTVDADGRILVHIADVAAYVSPGSDLDLDAEEKATSAYLPGRVDPMLPPELSNGVCSLSPGDDRRALTVTLDPSGAPAFRRTLIRSDHRFTYDEADAILDGGDGPAPELAAAVRAARAAADRYRDQRVRAGGLDLTTGETVFRFAGGKVADATWDTAATAAHRMIEELMVRANEAVAELLEKTREPALYRVHEPPEPESIEALVARLEALDIATPALPDLHTGAEAAAYAAALATAIDRQARGRPQIREGATSLVLRSLQQARYDPHNLGHAGLASRAYCHFTSPIRRYPDLVCHRALLHRLGAGPGIDEDAAGLAELALHTSAREREASALERRGASICLAHLLHDRLYDRGWETPFDGVVIGVAGFGAFVRFGDVFEGLLPARLLGDDRFELDDHGVALVGLRSGHRLRIGDAVAVTVRTVDRIRGRVALEKAN